MQAATSRQARVLRGVDDKVEYGDERSGTGFGVCEDGDGANGIPAAPRYRLQSLRHCAGAASLTMLADRRYAQKTSPAEVVVQRLFARKLEQPDAPSGTLQPKWDQVMGKAGIVNLLWRN